MKPGLPMIVVTATVAIDAMGIGLILPVMPELIRELTGQGISDAAFWGGLLAFSYAAMQVLFGPLLGNLSDRYGRRPVLLLSLLVMGLDYLLMAVAGSLWLLFVARLLSGITGATYATAFACIADLSTREKRSANFGLVGAAFGVGFILGPAIGGLLGELGPRAPFVAAALLALANAALGYFVLSETLSEANRRPFSWAASNPITALLRVTAIPALGSLVLVLFIFQIGHNVYPSIWAYFAYAQYGWGTGMVGISLAVVGLFMALVQGLLIRRILPVLGEWNTARFGLLLNVAMLVLLPFVWNGGLALALTPLMALGVVVTPALQGIMSARVGDDAQGALQGVLSAVQALASLIAPLAMTQTFRLFTEAGAPAYLPGAPFLLAALLTALAFFILLREATKQPPADAATV
ncbi:MAG: TCR/Tet family MFS transporter [Pseudomonadota bacterium]